MGCRVSPEPSLLTNTMYGCRERLRPLAPPDIHTGFLNLLKESFYAFAINTKISFAGPYLDLTWALMTCAGLKAHFIISFRVDSVLYGEETYRTQQIVLMLSEFILM